VDDPKAAHDDGGTNLCHGWPPSSAMEGVAIGALRLLDTSSLVKRTMSRVGSKKDEGKDCDAATSWMEKEPSPIADDPDLDPDEEMRP
jgi:hypothetical protein